MTKKLVFGVGINDADYITSSTVSGVTKRCKIYLTWYAMLQRCYSLDYLENKPTYSGCFVDKGWHSFMAFRDWMLKQDYTGKHLDKDLLIVGNKVYSESTCVFISPALNTFMLENSSSRGALPLGVSARGTKYQARCNNPFTKVRKHLGMFKNPEEAHLAWKKYKHELALEYAKLETDPRIIEALQNRYR